MEILNGLLYRATAVFTSGDPFRWNFNCVNGFYYDPHCAKRSIFSGNRGIPVKHRHVDFAAHPGAPSGEISLPKLSAGRADHSLRHIPFPTFCDLDILPGIHFRSQRGCFSFDDSFVGSGFITDISERKPGSHSCNWNGRGIVWWCAGRN